MQQCEVVSEYFSSNLVMEKSCKGIKDKPNTSKEVQVKTNKIKKKPKKRVKGQKDIRTLIKSKKNELMTYTKDFDLICKQSGIDVDPEQLQLAIALSKSLEDKKCTDNDIINAEKNLTCNQRRNKIRTTLQEYGFKTKNKPSQKIRRYKKHYKLVLVSDTEKQQRIADKYAEILIKNVCISKTNDESLCKECNVNSYLYNLTTNAAYSCVRDDEIFYVNDLVPKSLHKKNIFKDWSKIPGRPVSPKLERLEISFKGTEFSQEELDKLLSGPIEIAQDIVKKNYRSNSFKSQVAKDTPFMVIKVNQQNSIEITSKASETKLFEDNLITKSVEVSAYTSAFSMSAPTNRSCSPDLFDDEETIIMDNSKDNILVQEKVSEMTMMVKEQNHFMELTNCIGVIHDNCTDSKHIVCSTQGNNKTVSNSNDFMDLTECVPTNSQKNYNNLQSIGSYEKSNENCSLTKTNNDIEVIDLNDSTNFIKNIKPSDSNEKSFDDTIILVDEDYNNINTEKKQIVASSTSKDNFTIDLVETEYSSNILNIMAKHGKSTVDIEVSPEKNIYNDNVQKSYRELSNPDDSSCRIFSDTCKLNSENIRECIKSNKDFDIVDLTQPSNSKDCLSLKNDHSVKSIVTYEIHTRRDNISSNTTVFCRNFDHTNAENDDDHGEIHDGKSEKQNSFKEMDLTQSSNSEESLLEVYDNNKSLDDPITAANEHYNSNKELGINDEVLDCVDLCDCGSVREKDYSDNLIINSKSSKNAKTNKNNIMSSFFDIENDRKFDELLENVSSSKKSDMKNSELHEKSHSKSYNILDNSCTKLEKNYKNQELNVKPNYDCSNFKFSAPKNLIGKAGNNMDNAHVIQVDEDNNLSNNDTEKRIMPHNSGIVVSKLLETDMKENQSIVDVKSNLEFNNTGKHISLSKECCTETTILYYEKENTNNNKGCNNVFEDNYDIENSDIDLTQQSDSSEDTLCTPKIIVVSDELGRRNDISIDYDEVCVKANKKDYETNRALNGNNVIEHDKSGLKGEDVSGSSQYSEVFELSDNEFNYSMNHQVHDNDLPTSKQEKFDIGGMTIIDEFLNRKSLEKSKLRCSCSSNDVNTIDNEVDSCYPVVALKYNENLLDNDVNGESKSCDEIKLDKMSPSLKSKSDDNILIAKTPKHNDYIVKTDQVTPMPNYVNMNSPQRNEELDKFGIKPLKRKRAIQILTHIYNQTHPLMEIMPNDECSSPSKIRRKNNAESFPRKIIASQIDSLMEKYSLETSNSTIEVLEPNLSQKSTKSRKNSKNSQKSPEKSVTRECMKSSSKESTLYEETTSIPVIRNIECSPEDWVFQKREKAKVHSCKVPLHIAFHNYVSTRKSLHEAILKYEPINIDDIHKGLVASGYRYNPKDLLKFMDKKCITVKTADNSRKNKNM